MAASGGRPLLKILHVDPEKNWGGGESQVLGLMSYLSRQGHANHLLCHPAGSLCEASRKQGIKVLALRVRNDLDLRPVTALRSLINQEKYDIVHFHTKRAHALSLWCPRTPDGPKYVVTRRMDYPERNNWYNRCLYNRRVDGIVAISEMIGGLLVEAGVDRGKIRIIPSGIDPDRYRATAEPEGSSSGRTVIGTVAVLEKRKGHCFLLEAASLLKQQGYLLKLEIAGEGSLRTELEGIANRMNLDNEVVFRGFVDDIPGFMGAVQIFVLPSLYEGLGVAALEAMAAAKPVVATRVGGLAEVVVDGVTGYLVPPGDVNGLAAAIARLFDDKSVAVEMGKRGAARVREHFSLEQMAKKNEAYYFDLLDGRTADGSCAGVRGGVQAE